MKFPYPQWINEMPDGTEKFKEMTRFWLRLCILYAHPRGRIGDLASLLQINRFTLKSQVHKASATYDTKKGVRDLLGEDFAPPHFPK